MNIPKNLVLLILIFKGLIVAAADTTGVDTSTLPLAGDIVLKTAPTESIPIQEMTAITRYLMFSDSNSYCLDVYRFLQDAEGPLEGGLSEIKKLRTPTDLRRYKNLLLCGRWRLEKALENMMLEEYLHKQTCAPLWSKSASEDIYFSDSIFRDCRDQGYASFEREGQNSSELYECMRAALNQSCKKVHYQIEREKKDIQYGISKIDELIRQCEAIPRPRN